MDLLAVLQKTGPVFLLQLLLTQDQLDLTVTVVNLGVLGVDLSVQVQGDFIANTLLGITGECDIGGGNLEGGFFTIYIRSFDVHIKVIALSFVGR